MVPANLPPWIFSGHLTPKWSPKMVQKLLKNETKNVTNLDPILGLEWAKMRQDDSNEDIKSLKVPINIIFKKCHFTNWKNHTFHVLEAPKMSIRGAGRLPRGS